MHQYDHGGDVYGADRPALDFSISLNPMGPPPGVLGAARAAVLDWNRYPDPKCRALRQAAARRDRALEEFFLFGNGASDLIDRFLRALRPRRALLLAPTFSEYRRGLEGIGCEIEEFFLDKENDFTVLKSILNAVRPGVDLVFLCDPNNPTGRRMEPDLLQAILGRCRAAGTFLAVDQCFLELTEGDPNALVSQLTGGGLLLLRALTKSYALAGLRLGYCLCGDRALLERMEGLGSPWPVSAPAQAAGGCAFRDFPDWPKRSFLLSAGGAGQADPGFGGPGPLGVPQRRQLSSVPGAHRPGGAAAPGEEYFDSGLRQLLRPGAGVVSDRDSRRGGEYPPAPGAGAAVVKSVTLLTAFSHRKRWLRKPRRRS